MRKAHFKNGLAMVGIGLMAGLAWHASRPEPVSAAPSEVEAWKDCRYQEASECMNCHTSPTRNRIEQGALDIVLLTEYAIWKTYDKHAQAYAVLEGPRGIQMSKILGMDVTKEETGCLNCHAMANARNKQGKSLDKLDGVSCGGCHGPSSEWIGPHANVDWRQKTSDAKFKLGLRDLRDPVVRSELCMSCHIGNVAEGKVVTHAMFAAGHPPLPPIEIDTFSRNEPQHWRDAKDVPYFKDLTPEKAANYHLKDLPYLRTKFALIGGVVALRETMKLAADRADRDIKSPKTAWPEMLMGTVAAPTDDQLRADFDGRWPEIAMAHSDCFACHHDLKYPGFRQTRGFGFSLSARERISSRPGRPLVRMWPTALIETGLTYTGAKTDGFESRLRALAKACDVRPFGHPAQIKATGDDLVKWSNDLIGQLRDAKYDRDAVHKLMLGLCNLWDIPEAKPGVPTLFVPAPDYESARQIASLLAVAYEDYRGKDAADPNVAAVLAKFTEDLNLAPYTRRKERGQLIVEIVRELTGQKDTDGAKEFAAYLNKIDDKAALEKLVTNGFLTSLSRDLSNRKFTDKLTKDKAVIDQLQKFSDEEETNTLRRVANYDPDVFKANLKDLGKLLQQGK